MESYILLTEKLEEAKQMSNGRTKSDQDYEYVGTPDYLRRYLRKIADGRPILLQPRQHSWDTMISV